MLLSLSFLLLAVQTGLATPLRRREESSTIPTVLPDFIAENLGQLSPYIDIGKYEAPPDECTITQVNIIQRHGARFPTGGAGPKIEKSVAKFQNATSFSEALSFIQDFKYTLGTDDLISLGAKQSTLSGAEVRDRYSTLIKNSDVKVFVRADNSQRVIDSATNWTSGFFGNDQDVQIKDPVITGLNLGNDTLDNNSCDNAPDDSTEPDAWLEAFATDITARLNEQAPGTNLTNKDTLNLMQLCSFETQFNEELSPFCDLFDETEWPSFEFFFDLDKFYGHGYGNPLATVEGAGYVAELMTRLTGDRSFVDNDATQVDHTLNGSEDTFPLESAIPIFADFSHDNQMVSIASLIGLRNDTPITAAEGPRKDQVWRLSQIVPFAGRFVIERLECADNAVFVRFLLNDFLEQPTFCEGALDNGLCPLDSFVKSQANVFSSPGAQQEFLKCTRDPEKDANA